MKRVQKFTYDDFEIVKSIGLGAYGKVQLAKYKNNFYALKSIEKKKLARQSKEYQVFVERQILMKLKHPGVISLFTCFQDNKNLYFVLEYCQGGNLKSFITERFEEITDELRSFYILQMVKTIEYFQSLKIVHRDIKPQNILITSSRHLKFGDFGTVQFENCELISDKFKQSITKQKKMSIYLEPTIGQTTNSNWNQVKTSKPGDEQNLNGDKVQKTQSSQSANSDDTISLSDFPKVNKRRKATFVGTCNYVPPELLQAEQCGFASDIWALGCVVYQLYYGVTPFDGQSQYQIFEKIKQAQINFPQNKPINEDALDLIQQLLQKNPQDRLGCNSRKGLMFTDLLNHKYFKSLECYTKNDSIFNVQVPELYEHLKTSSQDTNKAINFLKTKPSNSKISEQFITDKHIIYNIIHDGIVEKRTFITYNKYYLALMNDLTLLRIKVEEPEKKRIIKIKSNLSVYEEPASLLDNETFKLIASEKVYKFRSEDASKWVDTINSAFLEVNSNIMIQRNQVNLYAGFQRQQKDQKSESEGTVSELEKYTFKVVKSNTSQLL